MNHDIAMIYFTVRLLSLLLLHFGSIGLWLFKNSSYLNVIFKAASFWICQICRQIANNVLSFFSEKTGWLTPLIVNFKFKQFTPHSLCANVIHMCKRRFISRIKKFRKRAAKGFFSCGNSAKKPVTFWTVTRRGAHKLKNAQRKDLLLCCHNGTSIVGKPFERASVEYQRRQNRYFLLAPIHQSKIRHAPLPVVKIQVV